MRREAWGSRGPLTATLNGPQTSLTHLPSSGAHSTCKGAGNKCSIYTFLPIHGIHSAGSYSSAGFTPQAPTPVIRRIHSAGSYPSHPQDSLRRLLLIRGTCIHRILPQSSAGFTPQAPTHPRDLHPQVPTPVIRGIGIRRFLLFRGTCIHRFLPQSSAGFPPQAPTHPRDWHPQVHQSSVGSASTGFIVCLFTRVAVCVRSSVYVCARACATHPQTQVQTVTCDSLRGSRQGNCSTD